MIQHNPKMFLFLLSVKLVSAQVASESQVFLQIRNQEKTPQAQNRENRILETVGLLLFQNQERTEPFCVFICVIIQKFLLTFMSEFLQQLTVTQLPSV